MEGCLQLIRDRVGRLPRALESAWIEHPGGVAGARSPWRPRPMAGAGAIELPEPEDERVLELTAVAASAPFGDLCRAM